jgi:nitrite reductase/ring-hydroxylating ferredoxin subunit
MVWHNAAKRTQIPERRGWPVRLDGRPIALFAVGADVYALDNQCLHVGSPIDDGTVLEGCVTCPWHGWVYDLRTGDLLLLDEWHEGLRTYPTRVVGDDVLVEVADR